jgi:hypothetical protein
MYKPFSRQSAIILGIIFIVAVFGSCLVAYQLFFHDCLWWECAPRRNFTVLDLNLPGGFFPADAEIHDLHYLREDNVSIEAASTTNYWKNGVAIYIVRRFATESKARQDYDLNVPYKFTGPSNESSKLTTYESKNADSSSIQCGYLLTDFRCIYVGRYQEFTVFFSGSIGENEMTQDDFIGAIDYIDHKMMTLLKQNS